MKKNVLYGLIVSIFIVTVPLYAGHDHGGMSSSMEQQSSQGLKNVQSAKATGLLLQSCRQQVDSIQRYIDKLQSELAGKSGQDSINNQLEEFECKLKEAKEIVRAIQIF